MSESNVQACDALTLILRAGMPSATGLIGMLSAGPRCCAAINAVMSLIAHGPCEREFALASVTKVLVALAVLVAVEEGSLALDDALGPPGSTLRHLLAHASGLSPDSDAVLTAPASRRIYSNRGFEIIGAALERGTAMTVAAYVHEALV